MNKNLDVLVERLTTLKKELSVAEFAAKCRIAQPMMDRYIKGKNAPSAEKIILICMACGCSSDWLLGLSDKHKLQTLSEHNNLVGSKIEELERQNAILQGQVKGLKFALSVLGQKGLDAQDFTPCGQTA